MMMEQGMNGSAQNAKHDEHRRASSVVAKAPSTHRAHAHANAMLRRIHAAYCGGKRKLGDHLMREYLDSMDAQVRRDPRCL